MTTIASNIPTAYAGTAATKEKQETRPSTPYDPNIKKPGSTDLDMNDFLKLMVAQFQNQDPENAASTSDMMNMLVQMSSVQAMSTLTEAATMIYSSSLVGKEVTVGVIEKGELKEIVGTVTGTGTYGGQPVVFVDGETYFLSDIMAVGRLPEKEDPDVDKPEGEKPDGDGSDAETPDVEKPEAP